MREVPIQPQTLENIGTKLNNLQNELNEDEADVLSGILSVAADAISRTGSGRGQTKTVTDGGRGESSKVSIDDNVEVLPLGDQFRRRLQAAFTPEADPVIIKPGSIPGPRPLPGEPDR